MKGEGPSGAPGALGALPSISFPGKKKSSFKSEYGTYSGMRIRNPYTLRLRTSVRKRKHDVKRIFFFKNEVRKRNCILGFLKIDVRKLNCILGFLKIDVRKLNCIRIFFQS